MSSTDDNKTLVLRFIQFAAANDIDAALALLHPEVNWWVSGDPAKLRVAGMKTYAQAERLLKGLKKAVPRGMTMTVTGVTAESDRVAVEIDGTGVWHTGQVYHNRYHFLFVVRDSKIVTVREYMDTLHLHEISRPAPMP